VETHQATSARPLLVGFGVVSTGLLVAFATDVALDLLTPAKVAFGLAGLALVIPLIVLKNPKAYWLFLLVLSIPFDITKWLSMGIVDSQALVDVYGEPMSGTTGLELYLTDVILVMMLLPWLARISLRREPLYFPKVGYLFALYLAWALLVSLINAPSFYLSIFELFRQSLYFILFIYLINNVSTGRELRNVVCAIFVGLIISAGSVILFFERGVGTDTVAFAGLHDQAPTTNFDTLTLNNSRGRFGSIDRPNESEIKRSQGIFRHPAIAAGLCGLVLPVVLAYLVSAERTRDRILLFLVFVWGFVALLLTFSRAGFIGFIAGALVFITVGGWSGLISRKAAALSGIAVALLVTLSLPFLLSYLTARSETFFMRFYMFEAAIQGYSQHPILGVGLNNSTVAMKEGKQELRDIGVAVATKEPADSYYLAILTEVGPLGSILFFGFFVNIVMIALDSMSEVAADMKPLLAGMVAGLAALATQSIADGPLAGHAVGGTLWLFAALIVAVRRFSPAETRPFIEGGKTTFVGVGTRSFPPRPVRALGP
jgi:hypothetical protein